MMQKKKKKRGEEEGLDKAPKPLGRLGELVWFKGFGLDLGYNDR